MCGQPHHGGAQVCALEYDIPLDWLAFGVWLSMLLRCHGDRILRVKGILNVIDDEQPIVIHGVQPDRVPGSGVTHHGSGH
jgi:G3E family GTPase